MSVLIADVGGTNTRIALAGPSGAPRHIERFANDAHSGLGAVLAAYAERHDLSGVTSCRIAIAGPVAGTRARLTNRDWHITAQSVAEALPRPEVEVRLVNDLAALGRALPVLAPAQLDLLRPGAAAGNGQALVFGLGTGVNICLLIAGETVAQAEMGHASLPSTVARQLGPLADHFPTCEDLFAGRGLERLHALTGGTGAAADIVADPGAEATVARIAGLIGRMSRELVFQYLPLDGIYFAGSVARGLLGGSGRAALCTGFEEDGRFADLVAGVPLRLILDDGAALWGLARPDRGAGAEPGRSGASAAHQ